jgi:hypothetical protein
MRYLFLNRIIRGRAPGKLNQTTSWYAAEKGGQA